jgi:pyruvate dehydrogenase E1 component alpha subunit
LVEAKTYRYVGHSRSDKAPYRVEGELEEWLARDPIDLYAKKLADTNNLGGRSLEEIRQGQHNLIDAAQETVLASPTGSIQQMFANILAPSRI